MQQAPIGCGHWLGSQASTVGSVVPLQLPDPTIVSEQLPSVWQQASTLPTGVKSMVSVGRAAPSRLSKRRIILIFTWGKSPNQVMFTHSVTLSQSRILPLQGASGHRFLDPLVGLLSCPLRLRPGPGSDRWHL